MPSHNLINFKNGRRTFEVMLSPNEKVIESLLKFSEETNLSGSHFSATGEVTNVILKVHNKDKLETIKLDGPIDIVSLKGDILCNDDTSEVQSQIMVSVEMGRIIGGKLENADAHKEVKIILEESPSVFQRRINPSTGNIY